MPFYAQRGEDKKLCDLLSRDGRLGDAPGFYVDIGAWEPTLDSVTKHFYDRGWRGINVEPVPHYYQKLAAERSRDINLQLAIGETFEVREFTWIEGTGLSTFHDEHARNGSNGRVAHRFAVQVVTLGGLCHAWVPHGQEIDFLKVDVEGWEREVLVGNDWKRFRPRVLVIEATVPGTDIPAWESWDQFVRDQDYTFVEFDGLNRWYTRN